MKKLILLLLTLLWAIPANSSEFVNSSKKKNPVPTNTSTKEVTSRGTCGTTVGGCGIF